MAETLNVTTETESGSTAVKCAGRLVAGNTEALHATVKSLFANGGRIVLDLSGITQMDSTGLGSVVALYVSAKSAGVRLELVNLAPKIKLLFSMTNLLSLFEPAGDTTARIP
ncbi:MAG TPA: STAS domain-containing protein [Bryobacteraceae bacterium]|jgi:anti-anti-sigma factor